MENTSESNKIRSVIKSNRIIEAKYRLNIREQKFMLYMVSLIEPDDKDFKFYRVKISEFEKILNLEGKKWGNIYQVVKDIVFSLNEKPLLITKEDGKKQIINWVASAEIEQGSGIVEFELSEKLKPYLLQLKSHFTKYNLENILKLKSGFSIRMYELLKSQQFKGKAEYDLEQLKVLLGIDDKYEEYTDFKKRVLKTAQEELKAKSDIYFEFKETRVNRRIHSILFSIFENKKVNNEQNSTTNTKIKVQNPIENGKNSGLIDQLVDIGFTETKAKELLDKGFENIKDSEMRQKIKTIFGEPQPWFEERLIFFKSEFKKRNISNPQGYFFKSLEDNYTSVEAVVQQKTETIKRKQKETEQGKSALEMHKKQLSDTIWVKKLEIAHNLLLEKPSILDEINEGDGSILFKGLYDRKVTPAQNFLNAPIFDKVRVITQMEKQCPLYFTDIKILELELTVINKQLSQLF